MTRHRLAPPTGLRRVLLLAGLVVLAVVVACTSDEPAGAPATSTSTESTNREVERPSEADAPNGPATDEPSDEPSDEPTTTTPRVPGVTTATGVDDLSAGATAWAEVDGAVTVELTSSADGSEQPAMWIPPSGPGRQPVIVSLPSWSYGHDAAAAVPIARWVESTGWGLLQPEARGASGRPESTGSDLVVADVLDAIEYALDDDRVDPTAVFLIGYSGGAMTALVVGSRHPDRVAGVAAFSPIYDLVRWYDDMRGWTDVYADDVARACGGNPLEDPRAHDECRHRSPAGHLDGARDAGLPIYLGQGDRDAVTFPDHARDAYDHARDHSLPELDDAVRHHFGPDDPPVLGARETGPVRFVEFEGEHDLVYHPALEWMVELTDVDAAGP